MTAREYLEKIPSNITPDQVGNEMNTTLHFDFGGNEKYSIVAINGQGEFKEGLIGEAECVVKADAADFVKIASGDMNPMMAVMMGKLKLSNPGVMMKYAKILGLM